MSVKPAVVVFDVIETLFALEPLRARLEAANVPGYVLETWFAQPLRNAFALSATGSYKAFRDVAVDSLKTVASANDGHYPRTSLPGSLGPLLSSMPTLMWRRR